MGAVFVSMILFVLPIKAEDRGAIRFNTNFPGGSLGKIVFVEKDTYRCHVPGQYNEEGRNRQTSWFFFRIENCKDRDVTLVMTDYIGEYNNRSGAVAMTGNIRPVSSEDGLHWQAIETFRWDDAKKEATLNLRPKTDALWIAHTPPYTHTRLLTFLNEIDSSPFVRIETFGESVDKRPLHLLTITDPEVPDDEKYNLWLMVRQHAWEAPTSFVGEGALRFLLGDEAAARDIRRKAVFHVVPTLDPDGCERGGVRFNRNGYDTNRHWSRIDSRSKNDWQRMPEICYCFKNISAATKERRPVDLLVSVHNQETGDCLMTAVDEDVARQRIERFESLLKEYTFYDSARPSMPIRYGNPEKADTIEALWKRLRVPTVVLELRVERHPKLDRHPTSNDFRSFGPGLVRAMFECVDGSL